MRANTFNPTTGVLTVDPVRAQAFEANAAYYANVFRSGRDEYAIPRGALTDPARLRAMSTFFFWTSWVASTNRPVNVGLALMVTLSVLPIGILQTSASIEQGTWWARSAEFLQTPLMNTLRWMRGPGDMVFSVGVIAMAYFVFGLRTGWSTEKSDRPSSDAGVDADRRDDEEPSASAGALARTRS